MTAITDYFSQLLEASAKSNHRYGVVLKGCERWQQQSLQAVFSLVPSEDIFLLGGTCDHKIAKSVGFKKGQQLLGQECQLLCCDFRDGFDANSFTAATGCVRGGGLVVILPELQTQPTLDQVWLNSALQQLIVVEESQSPLIPDAVDTRTRQCFEQQNQAVEKILKVVEGHRKRPLVMTADRGRGKSSALGIAAAQLLQQRTIHILVTAPSLATVEPVFEHAQRLLPQAHVEKGRLQYQQSILEFVAPDELLRCQRKSDCLFVDEASAIPIPMLQEMVETHHRAVFSTTIHGYEGCGRGFTVKFQSWLATHRPGTQFFHLEQPIRWNEEDPLEQWLFESFLLDAELSEWKAGQLKGQLVQLDKRRLVTEPEMLRSCFALLVNAHYQTSPNDLMLLLSDDAIQLHAIIEQGVCLACMLTAAEGKLESDLVEQIQLGRRRPKGNLVPALIANQLGVEQAAKQASLRIMRIAVHPSLQRKRIGSEMVQQLIKRSDYDFYSTSFGATTELVQFWRHCGFTPVKLGSQREQASGTHSLVMIYGDVEWKASVERSYSLVTQYALGETFRELEIELVRSLILNSNASVTEPGVQALFLSYSQGGASFDSVAPFLDLWWKSSPTLLHVATDLFIRKVVQRWSWDECCNSFGYTGRKQVEQAFREQMRAMLLSSTS